jgi:hypothetical protein
MGNRTLADHGAAIASFSGRFVYYRRCKLERTWILKKAQGNHGARRGPSAARPLSLSIHWEKVRHLNLDHARDRCDVEFLDGRRLSLRFHLFTANELKTCLGVHETRSVLGRVTFASVEESVQASFAAIRQISLRAEHQRS